MPLAGIINVIKRRRSIWGSREERRRPTQKTIAHAYGRNEMTKIIEKHGSLFRLSDAAYRQLLTLVIAGQRYDLWQLGRYIDCIHASMDSFQRDDAELELARLDAKRPSKASPAVGPNASNRRRREVLG